MHKQGLLNQVTKFNHFLFVYFLLFPITLRASFIEATIGTAVVNDATSTYYNPAALILVKNPQIVTLGSIAYFRTQFSGLAIQTKTGDILSGTSSSTTHYFLPSFYLSIPTNDERITIGFAVLTNFFNREAEANTILRYFQSNNNIQDADLVFGIGFKLNEYLSIGGGLSFSQADFLLKPIIGFPSLNIPDSESRNDSSGFDIGEDIGLLLKPSKSTLIGFNYRTGFTYHLSGTSISEGNPLIISDQYHYKFWTPERSVISINHFITSNLGVIGTAQFIQWDVFKKVKIHHFATPLGIILEATVPYHLHNSWLFTLGSHYKITPNFVIRIAGSYVEAPSTGKFQIANGDSFILGTSMGYDLNKCISIDGSYAHAFYKHQDIHISRGLNIINGVNKGERDAVSVKLTFNI